MRRILVSIIVPGILLLIAMTAIPVAVQAGGGCHGPDGSVYMEGEATVVRMDVCSFAPTVARVAVGTEVRFLNTANVDHMVTGRSGTWGSDMLRPGKEFSATFTTAGTYPFSCPLHPGMVGAIVVGDGVADGAAGANAAAAAVTAGSARSPEPRADAAGATATAETTDWTPMAISALGGLGAGAIAGTLIAGVLLNRRRSSSIATN